MKDMFENFNNISSTICNKPQKDCEEKFTTVFHKPYEDTAGNIVWTYGDTVAISFEFDGLIKVENNEDSIWESLKDFLSNKKVVVELFNYRNDCIYHKEYVELLESTVVFCLNEEESKQVTKGSYSLKITVKSKEEQTSLVTTLLSFDNSIIVK